MKPFVAPRTMAKLIELANQHRRSYLVNHSCDHHNGHPSVTLTVSWYPHGCDIRTNLNLKWHSNTEGRHRLQTASADGYHEKYRALTIAEAQRLISGTTCFFHGEATPPSLPRRPDVLDADQAADQHQ
ncbi:hypothetical protein [Nocardia nova]|uniref:hypothetical protein n=1 Tax=Nocardia nova TaxID=37330 RepID=UPI0033C688DB